MPYVKYICTFIHQKHRQTKIININTLQNEFSKYINLAINLIILQVINALGKVTNTTHIAAVLSDLGVVRFE